MTFLPKIFQKSPRVANPWQGHGFLKGPKSRQLVEKTARWAQSASRVHDVFHGIYLEPICPLFCLQKKVFSNPNKGHLGSRYVLYIVYSILRNINKLFYFTRA